MLDVLSKIREQLVKILDLLLDVEPVRDVITPLPIENYLSILSNDVKNCIDAYSEKKLDMLITYTLRVIATSIQLLDRVVDIREIEGKLCTTGKVVSIPQLNV